MTRNFGGHAQQVDETRNGGQTTRGATKCTRTTDRTQMFLYSESLRNYTITSDLKIWVL